MPTIRKALCAMVAFGALALPSSAGADFQTLYDDYRADGQIVGCEYYSSDLTAGLGAIPADVREYDPGFAEALNGALEQLAAGCGVQPESSSDASAGVTAGDGSPGPIRPQSVGLLTNQADTLPGILLAVIVLLGASLAVAALLGAARFFGWNLQRRLAPVGGATRGVRDRLADGLWGIRDRLGL
jgi:hypothetical protein